MRICLTGCLFCPTAKRQFKFPAVSSTALPAIGSFLVIYSGKEAHLSCQRVPRHQHTPGEGSRCCPVSAGQRTL